MIPLKLKIAWCMLWALLGCAWGSMGAPSVCSFGDPQFGELSHQHVEIEEPAQYRVGEENFVIIKLEKPDLPSGYFVNVLVDTPESPSSLPVMQGWYPKTSIRPLSEGRHVIGIRVNLIYKSS